MKISTLANTRILLITAVIVLSLVASIVLTAVTTNKANAYSLRCFITSRNIKRCVVPY